MTSGVTSDDNRRGETSGADVIKCPPVGEWAWEALTTQDTEVGAQCGQGHD